MESRRAADVSFESFWARYPRKVGKIAAKREWDKLRPGPELVKQIMGTLEWQISQWRASDPKFTPHPRTWLSQGRYLDEPFADDQPAQKAMSDATAMVLKLTGNGGLLR